MPEAVSSLDALADTFWRWQCREFPLTAFMAGVRNDDPVMFREAPADFDRRAADACGFLAQLDKVPAPSTSKDRATASLLRRELEDLRDFYELGAHQRPSLLPVGPEFNTIYFANMASIGDAAGAQLYLERLASVPQFFADVAANLRNGRARGFRYPRVVLERAESNMRAVTQGPVEELSWFGPFKRSTAARSAAVMACADKAKALIARELVPALTQLADTLRHDLMPVARDSVASADDLLGREYYERWVRHFSNSSMTADEIHEFGLSEARRVEDEIARVAADAGFPDEVAQYRRFLVDDPQFLAPTAEALRERVEITAKRIDRKIPAYFGRIPRITYGVESIPASMAARMPPAYAQPNPGDGSAPGLLWVSGLPQKCPLFLVPSLALHEGWPGHLMHLALVQESTDVPAFQRYNGTKYAACVEGWALYCESLGEEMGMYNTPHERFGRLDMELWRALRLVVDTGLHAKGWTRQQAIHEMASRVSLSLDTIEAEVDRYIALPAQALAYQIGNHAFRDYRQRAQSKLGDKFDIRAYHDMLLAAGPATLPVMSQLVDDWIDQRLAMR